MRSGKYTLSLTISSTLVLLMASCFTSSVSLDELEQAESPIFSSNSCEKPEPCEEEFNTPSMCQGTIDGRRFYGWGKQRCLAMTGLKEDICQAGSQPSDAEGIHCSPDPSAGECPIAPKICTFEYQPSRCQARAYRDRPLDWQHRPTAWGSNPCVAKQKLLIAACQKGLIPSQLEQVSCENDLSAGQCPPKPCPKEAARPSICRSHRIGKTIFAKPWAVTGQTACQARYKLAMRACQYANKQVDIKPSDLGDIICQDL